MLMESNIREYAHICSLGFCCHPYSYLRLSLNISMTRSPFDDMFTPYLFKSLPLFRQGWEEGCYTSESIKVTGQYQHTWGVYDKTSQSSAIHNFPVGDDTKKAAYKFESQDDLFLQAEKQVMDYLPIYLERKREQFSKFRKMIDNTRGPILFLRSNRGREQKESTLMLLDHLTKVRDSKPFELWVFQDSDLMDEDWGYPNLRVFRDKTWDWNHEGWYGNEELWNDIFKSVKSRAKKQKGQW